MTGTESIKERVALATGAAAVRVNFVKSDPAGEADCESKHVPVMRYKKAQLDLSNWWAADLDAQNHGLLSAGVGEPPHARGFGWARALR